MRRALLALMAVAACLTVALTSAPRIVSAEPGGGVTALSAQIPDAGCFESLAAVDPMTHTFLTLRDNRNFQVSKCGDLPSGFGIWLQATPESTLRPGPAIRIDLPLFQLPPGNSSYNALFAMRVDPKRHQLLVLYRGFDPSAVGGSGCWANRVAVFDLGRLAGRPGTLEPARTIDVPTSVDPSAPGAPVSSSDPTNILDTGVLAPACLHILNLNDLIVDPATGAIDILGSNAGDGISQPVSTHGPGAQAPYLFHFDSSGALRWTVQLGQCTSTLGSGPSGAEPTLLRTSIGGHSLLAGGCLYAHGVYTGGNQGGVSLPTGGSMAAWVLTLDAQGVPSGQPAYYVGRPGVSYVVADGPDQRLLFVATAPTSQTASSAAGPTAVIFDLRHVAYIGAPTIAANSSTQPVLAVAGGRWYSADQRGLYLGQATSTPPGEGQSFEAYSCPTVTMLADPVTHLLFMRTLTGCRDNAVQAPYFQVWRDDTSVAPQASAPNPDSFTQQIAEQTGVTDSQFLGHAEGTGARFRVIGGEGGAFEGGTFGLGPFATNTIAQNGGPSSPIAYTSREMDFGVVRKSDLNNYEANAFADVAEADTTTQGDLTTHGGSWPYQEQLCSASQPQATQSYGASSSDQLGCTPGKTVTAQSQSEAIGFSASIAGQTAGSLPFDIGQSGTQLTIQKDPASGLVTSVESWTSAFTAGTIVIDGVRTNVTCQAHGRTGTASCSYLKTLGPIWSGKQELSSGCVVSQTSGGAVANTCQTVLDQLNAIYPGGLIFAAPLPDEGADLAKGSPGGYQAIVQKELFEYLQDSILNYDNSKQVPGLDVLLVNDGPNSPSRLDLQLANVEAESHYGISKADYGSGDAATALPLPAAPAVANLAGAPVAQLMSPGQIVTTIIRHLLQGLAVLLRSPLQAVMAALVLLMLASPLLMAMNRKRLLEGVG